MELSLDKMYFSVVITNGDPSIIQNDEEAEAVQKWLEVSRVTEVTEKDEFDLACDKLDFIKEVQPRKIYRVIHPNPNECGYICFAEDYGD